MPDPRPAWVLVRRREIGVHIARLRAARQLTVDNVADASGLARTTVMKVEGGSVSAGLDVLLQLAHGLDVPIDQLVQVPEQSS